MLGEKNYLRLSANRSVHFKNQLFLRGLFNKQVWNDVGIVKQTNVEEENAIDVEFHDTNHHHSFRINNVLGHTMAALSLQALVLACEATEDSPR